MLISSWLVSICSSCAFYLHFVQLSLCIVPCIYWGLCPPGGTAEDSDTGDERGELPFSGEQNEAYDSLFGAGEGSLPEDHWTHALVPSLWRPDRCGDDPDQNRTQRESQNCSQEALMVTRGLAALGRCTDRDWSEQMETVLVEGCWAPQLLLHCCTRVAALYKCVMSGLEMCRLYGKYLRGICQQIIVVGGWFQLY